MSIFVIEFCSKIPLFRIFLVMHRMCMRIFSKGKAYVYDDDQKGRIEDGCKTTNIYKS